MSSDFWLASGDSRLRRYVSMIFGAQLAFIEAD